MVSSFLQMNDFLISRVERNWVQETNLHHHGNPWNWYDYDANNCNWL